MSALTFLCVQFMCFAFLITGVPAQLPGTWELLVENAGIASMHTAVTRWNNVVLLDRTGIGLSNLSLPDGQCRDDPNDLALTHDCSAHSALLNLDDNSIRPLEIFTDTWCSSGQFLPDGTLLQSGGNDDGTMKFRTFTPCAYNSTCDWVELENISLTYGRWYSTNQILPDGSIIIVGGIGTNSLEYYPPRPAGPVYFSLLTETIDNQTDNLYPYVHLLPQGNLFIFANNQSVLYDYIEDEIVGFFPELPGGPRNYPSAGSSVMLALEANYTMATIVICGGAQYGAYLNQSLGIDSSGNLTAQGSCGRIVATDPNPVWEMDDMPLVRIMGDMVMLPTGDVMIINGAQTGSQGYGFATDPCLIPVLYQPDEPLGQRFVVQNPGSIPRVYHSTANLLPDGRILVAGSNTHWAYTFEGDFPTELRIEAFSPDYLSENNSVWRPAIVKAPDMVQYGKLYNVYVTVPAQLSSTVEVNFASAPFTTHSFSQGQRLVKLVVTTIVSQVNAQYGIVFQAPPNGMVAPPGYYMMFVVNQGVPSVASWVQLIS